MNLMEIINIAKEEGIQVLAFNPDMLKGNSKRDSWVRIDPEENIMTEVDRRWERSFLASYQCLTRDDWGMSRQAESVPSCTSSEYIRGVLQPILDAVVPVGSLDNTQKTFYTVGDHEVLTQCVIKYFTYGSEGVRPPLLESLVSSGNGRFRQDHMEKVKITFMEELHDD